MHLPTLVLALLAATGPPAPAPRAPSAPAAPAARLDAKGLIVQLADLPVRFAAKSGGYRSSSEFTAVYLRPEVLGAEDLPEGGTFAVMADIVVSVSAEKAQEAFVGAGGLSAASIRADLATKSSKPAGIRVDALTPETHGADHVVGFRVAYELQGQPTVEYRYRVLSGPVVSSLIVAARAAAGGLEPKELAPHAAAVLEKQVGRILAARRATP